MDAVKAKKCWGLSHVHPLYLGIDDLSYASILSLYSPTQRYTNA